MKELSAEEEKLLLKDLCSRLSYGVICKCYHTEYNEWDGKPFIATYDSSVDSIDSNGKIFAGGFDYEIDEVRPYLRPMSSMTEEEFYEYNYIRYSTVYDKHNYKRIDAGKFHNVGIIPIDEYLDWLNAHHFDYRNLIEKGLALEAPKDMYVN